MSTWSRRRSAFTDQERVQDVAEFTLPKNSQIQQGRHWPAQGAKQPRTFKVYRWSPDDGMKPRVY